MLQEDIPTLSASIFLLESGGTIYHCLNRQRAPLALFLTFEHRDTSQPRKKAMTPSRATAVIASVAASCALLFDLDILYDFVDFLLKSFPSNDHL